MSHMNESCHILARVTSHMHEASHIWMHARWSCAFDNYRPVNNLCRIWMSPVIFWHESRPICMRHLIYECMHVGRVRSTIIDQSIIYVAYEWVLSYVGMSHVPYAWGISYMNACTLVICVRQFRTSQGVMSRMNESCCIWMSHVTFEWVMAHMRVCT